MKLKITFKESIELLKTITHKTFLQAIDKHWKKIDTNEVEAQSVCWLFCWAKEGKGSVKVENQARQVFDKIFGEGTFVLFEKKITHEWAKCARNSPSKEIGKQLENKLKN